MNFVALQLSCFATFFATAPFKSLITKVWLGRESNPRHEDFQSADFTLLLTSSD